MKRTALFSLILFLVTIFYSSCREDVYADWKILNEQWLEKHKNDSGFVQTSSGLFYKVNYQGIQSKPYRNGYVVLNYTLSLVDGTIVEKVSNGTYQLPYVISAMPTHPVQGLAEGIRKMNTNGNYVFYVPSALAFDTITDNPAIPPHSNLIYEVELVDVQNVN